MVDIQDLQSKLNNMLNGKDNPNNVKVGDYISDFEFIVLSYAQYLDNIYNTKTNKNMIPVYISEPSGTVEPIPELMEINMDYSITLYFPIRLKEKFFKMMNYFIDVFAGRMINFNDSGNALCNITVPQFSEIEEKEFVQFQDYLTNHYKLPMQRTEVWGAYTFTLYLHQLKNLGEEDGFILGNQIKYSLSFTYNNTTYSEDVILASSARSYTSDPLSQQILGQTETTAINKNSSYGDSIQVYAKNSSFWNQFRYLFENGYLQGIEFTLTKTYTYDNASFERKLILVSCPQAIDYGEAITYTFTFAKSTSL